MIEKYYHDHRIIEQLFGPLFLVFYCLHTLGDVFLGAG